VKLAIIAEQFDPRGGGAERNAAELAEVFTGRGHAVTVLAGRAPRDLAFDHAEVVACPRGTPDGAVGLLAFAHWASGEIERQGFDASLSLTMAVPATVVQPLGGTVRETLARNVALRDTRGARALKRVLLALSPKQQALLALERRTLNHPRVQSVAALSDYVVHQLQAHYSLPAGRISVIRNAVGTPELDDATRRGHREQVRRGLDLNDDQTVYLFSAMNPRLKGLPTLLRAMRRVKETQPDAVALLTGQITYREYDQAVRLGVAEHVRMIGPTQRMVELYCAADATVLPTFYDPASRVVLESLVLGTPAISTTYNGASELITPEGAAPRGRVIPDPADDAALAEAMLELADPATRDACRAATRDVAGEVSLQRHLDSLERLLAAGPAPAAETAAEP